MKKTAVILFCVLWMGFIFYNSSNNGVQSNNRSYNFLNDLRNIKHGDFHIVKDLIGQDKQKDDNGTNKISLKKKLQKAFDIPDTKQGRLNIFIRKNAHAFEYFVLAVIVSIVLSSFGLKGRRAIIYIMFLCLFYAVTDEFHQQLVAGRTSLVSDVLIDFFGSLLGIFAYYVIRYKLFNRGKRSSLRK